MDLLDLNLLPRIAAGANGAPKIDK